MRKTYESKTHRPREINRSKYIPTCSLSNLSWLMSRSFFCNSSCCCWISSKCSNKSWRKWVTWAKASVLWLLPSLTISGSGDFVNGIQALGRSCSFCVSLLLSVFFTAVEDFDRKTRVNCRSDRELPALVGDLLVPTKGASDLNWFWSMFPLQGKSVVITIWEIFVHVLSNTALKLLRFIWYMSGHHGSLTTIHVTSTWRTAWKWGSILSSQMTISGTTFADVRLLKKHSPILFLKKILVSLRTKHHRSKSVELTSVSLSNTASGRKKLTTK